MKNENEKLIQNLRDEIKEKNELIVKLSSKLESITLLQLPDNQWPHMHSQDPVVCL